MVGFFIIKKQKTKNSHLQPADFCKALISPGIPAGNDKHRPRPMSLERAASSSGIQPLGALT